jgi:hypothetical protein
MAITRGRLANIQTISSTAGVIYANPAGTTTFVGCIILHNTHTATETVQLYNVPDSTGSVGTAALSNRFMQVDIAANATVSFPFDGDGIVLADTNDSIQASSTSAGKVTVQLSGPKQTA